MVVSTEQVKNGIIKYVDAEIGAKSEGAAKFLVYFVLPSIPKKVTDYLGTMRSSGVFNDVFDENGNVELDAFRERAREAMQKCVSVEVMGLAFRESDIDALYEYIRRG